MGNSKIMGIDFGTTKSSVGCFIDGEPFIIPHKNGKLSMPSELYVKEENGSEKVYVGWDAKQQQDYSENGYRVKYSKRFAGTSNKNKGKWWYENPQCVFGYILADLRLLAEEFFNCEIKNAVITVPIHFDLNQRRAILEGAKIAGITVIRLLNEPTACALAYSLLDRSEQIFLVVDVGGGTTDVAIVEYGDGLYEVLHTSGDTNLGGVDFEDKLYSWLLSQIQDKYGIRPTDIDKIAESVLRESVEVAKKELSEDPHSVIFCPWLTINGKSIDSKFKISKEVYEKLTERLSGQVIEMIRDVMSAGKKGGVKRIDTFLLMGSASKTSGLRANIEKEIGISARRINLQTSVAKGAVLLAGVFTGENKETLILDCVQDNYGIGLAENKFEVLVEKDTPIPYTVSKEFTTSEHDQTEFEIKIYRGRNSFLSENKYIGKLEVKGIPSRPAGELKITITFDVNVNMDISVTSSTSVGHGNSNKVFTTLKSEFGLSEERLEEYEKKVQIWVSRKKLG